MHFSDNRRVLAETPGPAEPLIGWWLAEMSHVTDLSQQNVCGGGCCSCLNEGGRALMRRFRTASDLGWLLGSGRALGVIQCTATLGHSFPVQQNIHSLSVSVESRNTEK